MRKCIYCKQDVVQDSSVIDFCDSCGKGVWGEKMFQAIVNSMESARKRGDI